MQRERAATKSPSNNAATTHRARQVVRIALAACSVVVLSRCSVDPPSRPATSSVLLAAEARARVIAGSQRNAPGRYELARRLAADAGWSASGAGLEAQFSEDAVEIRGAEGHAVRGRLVGFGYAGNVRAVAPVAETRVEKNRLERRRGEVREWYVNGPLGLEQGFIVSTPPVHAATASGELVVEVSLTGDLVANPGTGDRVELRDSRGTTRFAVTDLIALDADGHALPTRMEVVGQTLALKVDDRNARYPIEIDPLYTPDALSPKLALTAPQAYSSFGHSVGAYGRRLLVGAPNSQNGSFTYSGFAYAFQVNTLTNTWDAGIKLAPTNLTESPVNGDTKFGASVAVSSDYAIVGEPGRWVGTTSGAGAAYVYYPDYTTPKWSQPPVRITDPLPASTGRFGASVAASEATYVVVGEPGDDDKGASSGSAFVFTPASTGLGWKVETKLLASDGAANQNFGNSVAASMATAVVGSASGAYVFLGTASSTNFTFQQKLVPSDANCMLYAYLGNPVAVDKDTAVVAIPFCQEAGKLRSGAVFVFTRSGTTWSQQAKLVPSDAAVDDRFGTSVAVTDNTIVVGAPQDEPSSTRSGAVYVFTRLGTTWTQEQKLVPSDPTAGQSFGCSVASSSQTSNPSVMVIGSRVGDTPPPTGGTLVAKPGAAYAFVRTQPKDAGGGCDVGGECKSGICSTDKVCCDAVCSGSCMSCLTTRTGQANGTCANVTSGTDLDAECTPGACDGAGACTATCTTDAHCDTSHYCSATAGGTCVPKKATAAVCASDTIDVTGKHQCLTGNCVDGVCCDTACTGTCQACAAAVKQTGPDGTCGLAKNGADPHGDCPVDTASQCGADGFCNGAGACRASRPQGASCGVSQCSGTVVSGDICNGAGTCAPNAGIDCAPFKCASNSCTTSCTVTSDCAASGWCSAGTCQPRGGNGAACGLAEACASGNCVDGVCCDKPCAGQCEACDSFAGTCGPINGAPHGKRNACEPGFACNSASATCEKPAIATCDGDHTTTGADGAKQDCAPYKCESTGTCRTTCNSVGDCVAPTICDSTGQCVPPPAETGGESGCSVVSRKPGDTPWQLAWLAAAAALALARRRAGTLKRSPTRGRQLP